MCFPPQGRDRPGEHRDSPGAYDCLYLAVTRMGAACSQEAEKVRSQLGQGGVARRNDDHNPLGVYANHPNQEDAKREQLSIDC
jgi:hypothetical protein